MTHAIHKLYERGAEQQRLASRLEAVCRNERDQNELILMSGPSGTGKTYLAQDLERLLAIQREQASAIETSSPCRYYFCQGKFDQQHANHESDAAVEQALASLARQMATEPTETPYLSDARLDVVRATAGNHPLLVRRIPELAALLGPVEEDDEEDHRSVKSELAFERVICSFLSALASNPSERVIVMLLDDLQWVSHGSIGLLKAVLSDASLEGLMVVGTCRTLPQPLASMLQELEGSFDLNVMRLPLQNLSLAGVEAIVTDTFQDKVPDCSVCEALARMIHARSGGNMFHTVHLLQVLLRDVVQMKAIMDPSLLSPSMNKNSGSTNSTSSSIEDRIAMPPTSIDPAQLVLLELRALPEALQEALQVAACLGTVSDRSILQLCVPSLLPEHLDSAHASGLFVSPREDDAHHFFTHDIFQEAAYALIPLNQRGRFHLSIARKLMKDTDSRHLSTIANQFSRCLPLISDREERASAALICFKAGRKAEKTSSFRTASYYFAMGRELLPQRHWRDWYQLSLCLFSVSAEVEFILGNTAETEILVDEVITQARSFQDKIPAFTTQIQSLGSQKRFDDCVKVALDVLQRLGVRFPRNVSALHVAYELKKTDKLLRTVQNSDIASLPLIQDEEKLAAMAILNVSMFYAFFAPKHNKLSTVIALRMIQVSIQYGLSALSSMGFASYAFVLGVAMRQLDKAHFYGQIAMRILERFQSQEWIPRVNTFIFGSIISARVPPQNCYEPLRYANEAGLTSGDVEFAMLALHIESYLAFASGMNLPDLYNKVESYLKLMVNQNQDSALALETPLAQNILNLLGEADDPLVLTGKHMNEVDAMQGNGSARGLISFSRGFMACLLHEYGLAERALGQVQHEYLAPFFQSMCCFYLGLTLLSLAPSLPWHSKWQKRRRGEECLKELRFFASTNPYLSHRVLLLEAKLALCNGDMITAIAKFESSVEWSQQHNNVMDAAICTEHMGMALSKIGNVVQGRQCLDDALNLYGQWGATVKVNLLRAECSGLEK